MKRQKGETMPAQVQTLSLSRFSRLRRQELIERRVLRLIVLGLMALSLAGLLYLTQASAVTTTTYRIRELQAEKQRLQRERDRLRADIAVLAAPEVVQEKARKLGFRPALPSEFLLVREIPVMARQSPATSPTDRTFPSLLDSLLARTENLLRMAMSLLPEPAQAEAGPAPHRGTVHP
jgi:cell division protein FtsL